MNEVTKWYASNGIVSWYASSLEEVLAGAPNPQELKIQALKGNKWVNVKIVD